MAATDHSRSEAAKQRRQDQLQRWLGSETDRTEAESRGGGPGGGGGGGGSRRSKVRFAQGAVFMAACSAGDREEVAALLRQGADINHANIDGLTALHQVEVPARRKKKVFPAFQAELCNSVQLRPPVGRGAPRRGEASG